MSHDDKYGRLRATAQSALDEIERCRAKGFYDPVQWLEPVLKAFMDLSQSAIGASAEKAMDRIVENSREQIDEAARNMGKAASIGLGVGPIPAPVSHDAATPRTPYHRIVAALATIVRLHEDDSGRIARDPVMAEVQHIRNDADQLERELADVTARRAEQIVAELEAAARSPEGDTTSDVHSCSYYCKRPDCVKAQRDELRDRLERSATLPTMDNNADWQAAHDASMKLDKALSERSRKNFHAALRELLASDSGTASDSIAAASVGKTERTVNATGEKNG